MSIALLPKGWQLSKPAQSTSRRRAVGFAEPVTTEASTNHSLGAFTHASHSLQSDEYLRIIPYGLRPQSDWQMLPVSAHHFGGKGHLLASAPRDETEIIAKNARMGNRQVRPGLSY